MGRSDATVETLKAFIVYATAKENGSKSFELSVTVSAFSKGQAKRIASDDLSEMGWHYYTITDARRDVLTEGRSKELLMDMLAHMHGETHA